jgi:hypothetical protein
MGGGEAPQVGQQGPSLIKVSIPVSDAWMFCLFAATLCYGSLPIACWLLVFFFFFPLMFGRLLPERSKLKKREEVKRQLSCNI